MKKNNKGFTLIELLAVIVILAIIALIAVPIVLNMISNARKSAAKSSAYGYIQAIDDQNALAGMGSEPEMTGLPTAIADGNNTNVTTINDDVNSKGTKPTHGTVTIVNGKVTAANDLCFGNNYAVDYDGTEASIDNGGSCS